MKTIWSIIFSIWVIYKIIQVINDPSKRKVAGLMILIIFTVGLFIYFYTEIGDSIGDSKRNQEWEKEKNIENECRDEALTKSDIYIYLDKYPCGYSQYELIDSLYNTEDDLWELVLELKTKDTIDEKYCSMDKYYNYYLEKYPTGKYIGKAKKAIIDLRVDAIEKSVKGTIHPVEAMYGDSKETTEVRIKFPYRQSLDIIYSGKIESREIHISSSQDISDTTIILPRGEYRMVISSGWFMGRRVEEHFEMKDYSHSSYYSEWYTVR
jgi:hypothetical protein